MLFPRVVNFLGIVIIGSAAAFAAHAGPASKLKCTARELKTLDCHLTHGRYDLRLLKTTLAWNDGTWHTVDPLPLAGEGVEWENVEFAEMAGRPILQLWFWDKGVGESRVQSLHWFTTDADHRALTLLAEGVVRRRTPRADKTPLYDRLETHHLRATTAGLEWTLGNRRKVLPPLPAAH